MLEFFAQTDNIGRLVALLLLGLSIATWITIFWKAWYFWRAIKDNRLALPAFWQASDLAQAQQRMEAIEREPLASLLVAATTHQPTGSLATQGSREQQLTRVLREALHLIQRKLQFGQSLLATAGSTSPFIGLFGTVWGIYHALVAIAGEGQISIDKVAGPVGEALIMTAAGLAVAIPAVIAYNIYSRLAAQLEGQLDGFARDLRELLSGGDADFGPHH